MADTKLTADTGSLEAAQQQQHDKSGDTFVSLGDSCDGAPELATAGVPPAGGGSCTSPGASAVPDYCPDQGLPTKVASGVGYDADTS